MRLRVIRSEYGETYTSGDLYIGFTRFCCTHEDKVRDLSKEKKVYGKTAIPAGTYVVDMNIKSAKYAAKSSYAFTNGYMPRLRNVPQFEGVLIHGGNTSEQTLGCVLVGRTHKEGQDWMGDSLSVFKELYLKFLLPAKERGEEITIEIVNL